MRFFLVVPLLFALTAAAAPKNFLVYFGTAMLVVALGRTALELRAQRRAREIAQRELEP